MSADEGMKFAFIIAAIEESPYWDPMTEEAADAIWDEWIARVRRDAAREALDGLDPLLAARDGAENTDGIYWARETLAEYRDTEYPEETP